MNKKITILKTLNGFRIQVDKKGYIKDTHIFIRRIVEENLITKKFNFQKRYFEIDKKYYLFDSFNNILFLPLIILEKTIDFIESHKGYYVEIEELEPIPGKKIDINLVDWFKPRNELQAKGIEFLHSDPNQRFKGLSLQPGAGKTASVIQFVSQIKRRAWIGQSGLKDEWHKDFLKFTDVKSEDIYIIEGRNSLMDLIENIDKDINPKVILASLGTVDKWANRKGDYQQIDHFAKMIDLFNIGIKAEDEVHRRFFLRLVCDIQTNPKYYIPLTATFIVTDPSTKEIYEKHYPKEIRFGEDLVRKYINVYCVKYNLSGILPKKTFMKQNGYSHVAYEKTLLDKKVYKDMFSKYLSNILNLSQMTFFDIDKEEGRKLLLLFSTKNMCEKVKELLLKEYPDKKIETFLGGDDNQILRDNEVIVSTPKSAGTGKDIPNLLIVNRWVCVDSEAENRQNIGRLREIEDEEVKFYYVADINVPKHLEYHSKIIHYFKDKVKSHKEMFLY